MYHDHWHYPRTTLAEQVLKLFNSGLSSALVFFAPRRMGKTEFLLKDIQPLANKEGWNVFYFSFLDTKKRAQQAFTIALAEFAKDVGIKGKILDFLKHIKEISGEVSGIKASVTFDTQELQNTMKDILLKLAKHDKVLLLLDEIQTLAEDDDNHTFIASLRTILDIHKDHLKVIFTGSSREGLRRMFSQSNAPFFHFGQNLPFPELDYPFIEHLANVYHTVTRRNLDIKQLWKTFEMLEKIPQLARSLVERLVLHPDIDIATAEQQLLNDLSNDRAYIELWTNTSKLEQLLLRAVAQEETALFSETMRAKFSKELGVSALTVPTIQSAVRTLLRKNFIGRTSERGNYFIDDPNFKSWLLLQ